MCKAKFVRDGTSINLVEIATSISALLAHIVGYDRSGIALKAL